MNGKQLNCFLRWIAAIVKTKPVTMRYNYDNFMDIKAVNCKCNLTKCKNVLF